MRERESGRADLNRGGGRGGEKQANRGRERKKLGVKQRKIEGRGGERNTH